MRLYISYAYADRQVIRLLAEAAKTAGFEPTYEQTLDEDATWYEQLEDKIALCDAFLVALSAKSVGDDWCRWELRKAIELNKPLIPTLIQPDVPLPFSFAKHPYADFTDRTTEGTERFVHGLNFVRVLLPKDDLLEAPTQPSNLPSHALTGQLKADPNQTMPSRSTMSQSFYDRARSRRSHEVDEKLADYEEAIRLDPNFADAYAGRGANRSIKGDYDGAMEDYNYAIHLNPSLAYAHFNRGMAYEDRKDTDAALRDYDSAIRLNADYVDAYNSRGNLRYNLGDYPAAISDYDAIVRINPKQPNTYFNRGNAREKAGDFQGAIEDWSRFLHLGGGNEMLDPDMIERRISEAKKKLRDSGG